MPDIEEFLKELIGNYHRKADNKKKPLDKRQQWHDKAVQLEIVLVRIQAPTFDQSVESKCAAITDTGLLDELQRRAVHRVAGLFLAWGNDKPESDAADVLHAINEPFIPIVSNQEETQQ